MTGTKTRLALAGVACLACLVGLALMARGCENGRPKDVRAASAEDARPSREDAPGVHLAPRDIGPPRQEIPPSQKDPDETRSLAELYGAEHPLGKLSRRDLEIALSYWTPVYELRLAKLREHMDPSDPQALLKEARFMQWTAQSRAVSDALLRGSYFVEKDWPKPPRVAKPGQRLQTTTCYFEGKQVCLTIVLSEKRYPDLKALAEYRTTQSKFRAHRAADAFNALPYATREKIFTRYKAIRAKTQKTQADTQLMRQYFPPWVSVHEGSLIMRAAR